MRKTVDEKKRDSANQPDRSDKKAVNVKDLYVSVRHCIITDLVPSKESVNRGDRFARIDVDEEVDDESKGHNAGGRTPRIKWVK